MDHENSKWKETLRKAKIYFASGQLEKSVRYFSLAERQGHELALIWMSRGAAQMALGNYSAAKKDFTLVLSKDPQSERAHYFRGVAMVALGEYESAIADLTQSLIKNNNRGIAHLMRGLAYGELGLLSDAKLDINSASAFSSAEFESFANLFGTLPGAFKNSRELLSKENAPWNNLLTRKSGNMLLSLAVEQ